MMAEIPFQDALASHLNKAVISGNDSDMQWALENLVTAL